MMNYENEQQARCPHHRHWPIRSNDRLNDRIYFHIPYGANGGYIHFGDALIYIAAHSFAPPVLPWPQRRSEAGLRIS